MFHLIHSLRILAALAAVLLVAEPAFAYVGPGAGMELVGYAMSLLAWIGVALFTVLLYPFYTFVHWLRGKKNAPQPAPSKPTAPPPEATSPPEA